MKIAKELAADVAEWCRLLRDDTMVLGDTDMNSIAELLERMHRDLAAYERPIEGVEEIERRHANMAERLANAQRVAGLDPAAADTGEFLRIMDARRFVHTHETGDFQDVATLLIALRRERALREEAEKQAERDKAICEALRKMNVEAEERAERAVRELARLHSLIRALQQAAAKEAAATTTEDRNRAHGAVITALGPLLMVKTGDEP